MNKKRVKVEWFVISILLIVLILSIRKCSNYKYESKEQANLVSSLNDTIKTWKDKNNKSFEALVTYFEINVGLSVQDWTSVVRIANIDVTALKGDLSSGPDLPALMDQATDLLKNTSGIRPVWYTTRKVRSFIRSQVEKKTGFTLQAEDLYNRDRKVPTYAGYPIRALDTLLNTEVRVV